MPQWTIATFATRSIGSLLLAALAGGAMLAVPQATHAQNASDQLKPKDVSDSGVIEDVVLYRGRAAVTRRVRRDLSQGVWAIRISGLPATTVAQSLQAKVARGGNNAAGGEPKLLGVEYAEAALAEFGGTPEGVALARKLEDLKKQLGYVSQDAQQLEQQAKLVEQIGVRATANATQDGGTQSLNLESVSAQLKFVAEQRARIVQQRRGLEMKAEGLTRQIEAAQHELAARGGADRTQRTAVVVIAQPEGGPVEVSVTYVVGNATWEPVYNIRGAGDRTGVEIEYDAMITQNTGEDWKDVRLALSTAQPTRASSPPPVVPWFVDVFTPPEVRFGRSGGTGGVGAAPGGPPERASAARRKLAELGDAPDQNLPEDLAGIAIESLSLGAEVQETGTAVSFDLPRTLTIPTDDAQKQRTRICTVAPTAKFVYTAQPIVTQDIYLRGDLTNASAYQLLPGRAQIFMGGDFIGETGMPSVAPKDDFKVFFGPDRALRAKRELVAKTTGSSGFFGGSELTTWNYRVTIDNGTGRDAAIELFDRYPISRNEKIEAKIEKPSAPLSTDKAYVEGPRTQGILRWDLNVPAGARNDNALAVTWSVLVSRPNNVQTTALPAD